MRLIWLLSLVKLRSARNFMRVHRERNSVNFTISLIFAVGLAMGLFSLFAHLFHFIDRFEIVGPLLLDRIMAMSFLAFFVMLIFSNLVVALTTLYRSAELEFLMSVPLRFRETFWAKYIEAVFYSSWAFLYLSLPLFLAYGMVRHCPWYFYFLAIAGFVPFVLLAGAVGQITTLLLTAFLPARRGLWIVAGMSLLVLLLGGLRLFNQADLLRAAQRMDFNAMLDFLRFSSQPLLPSHWMTDLVLNLGRRNWPEVWHPLALLLANAWLLHEVLGLMIPKLFYSAWTRARENPSVTRPTVERSLLRRKRFFWVVGFPPRMHALVSKDLLTFVRDPGQWLQFAMLLGLLAIYLVNLRSTPLSGIIPFWNNLIIFFNLGATAFIFAIISTRFMYPLLSLEGKKFWVLGISPLSRRELVMQKYWFAWAISFLFAVVLLLVSSWLLRVPENMIVLSVITLFILSLGLSSLATGIGAALPNFREDNPARIANGVGGVLNITLSLFYIVSVLLLEAYPTFLYVSGRLGQGRFFQRQAIICVTLLAIIHTLFIIVPLRLGLRRWEKLEF